MTADPPRGSQEPPPPAGCGATGAPRDQGIAQGAAGAAAIQARLRAERRRRGPLAWRQLRGRAASQPLAALRYHLVQIHERLEGIALGSRTGARDLGLLWTTARWAGLGGRHGAGLEARLELPPELAALARPRRSQPDSSGFASIEVALDPFPGCLAGVNERGVAVAVLDEPGALSVPISALAQDLLLRGSSLEPGLAHLCLRARYTWASGTLIAADRSGRAAHVTLTRGGCAIRDLAVTPSPATSTVRIDPAERTLALHLPAAPPVELTLDA